MLGTVFSTKDTHLVSISRDGSMKLIEVATQRFIDNITSITPSLLKGGLMALAAIRARTSFWRAGPTACRRSTRCSARRRGRSATTST